MGGWRNSDEFNELLVSCWRLESIRFLLQLSLLLLSANCSSCLKQAESGLSVDILLIPTHLINFRQVSHPSTGQLIMDYLKWPRLSTLIHIHLLYRCWSFGFGAVIHGTQDMSGESEDISWNRRSLLYTGIFKGVLILIMDLCVMEAAGLNTPAKHFCEMLWRLRSCIQREQGAGGYICIWSFSDLQARAAPSPAYLPLSLRTVNIRDYTDQAIS